MQAVYKGIPDYPNVFPSIAIRPQSWDEEYADLRDTVETDSLIITAYIQLGIDKITDQQNLRSIVQDIRLILGSQENITLGGLIDSSRLTTGQYGFDQKESSLYYCDIVYTVRKRFSRYA